MQPLRIMVVGAHPDDCEFRCGGVAALWKARGERVCFVSLTDGGAGHHEMDGIALAGRRAREARAAADVIGIESRVLNNPDGHLEPTLANRLALIRVIRRFQADVVITNRPNDYHPDHRYTAQLVQDSAFSLTVPLIAPDTPALRANPVVLYFWDAFQKPAPFQADVVIDIDAVFDKKIAMLHRHESQMYEWLPWLEGTLETVPEDEAGRMEWLRRWYASRAEPSIAQRYRASLVERYGPQRGGQVAEAEAFEVCEYGGTLDAAARERIFGGL